MWRGLVVDSVVQKPPPIALFREKREQVLETRDFNLKLNLPVALCHMLCPCTLSPPQTPSLEQERAHSAFRKSNPATPCGTLCTYVAFLEMQVRPWGVTVRTRPESHRSRQPC